jgi:hypothetical protein
MNQPSGDVEGGPTHQPDSRQNEKQDQEHKVSYHLATSVSSFPAILSAQA